MEKMKFRGMEIEVPRKKSESETDAQYNNCIVEHLKKYYDVPKLVKIENESDLQFDSRKQEAVLKYYRELTEMAEELSKEINSSETSFEDKKSEKLIETIEDDDLKSETEKSSKLKGLFNRFRKGNTQKSTENKDKPKKKRKKKSSDNKPAKKEIINETDNDEYKKKPNLLSRVFTGFKTFINRVKRDKNAEKQVEYTIEETDFEEVKERPRFFERILNTFRKNDKNLEKKVQTEKEEIKKENEEVKKVQKELEELKNKLNESEKLTKDSLEELKKLREECIRLQTENQKIKNIPEIQSLIARDEIVKEIVEFDAEKVNNFDIKCEIEDYVNSQMIPGITDVQEYYAEKYPFYQEKTREEYAELADFYINLFNSTSGYNMLECAERELAERNKKENETETNVGKNKNFVKNITKAR